MNIVDLANGFHHNMFNNGDMFENPELGILEIIDNELHWQDTGELFSFYLGDTSNWVKI